MNEKNVNELLWNKILELNELEIKKMKLITAIFMKTSDKIMNEKVESLKLNFQSQAQFYGQNLEDYQEEYSKIISKYQEQLSQVIEKYSELFVNMQLELQEAECNQKIAITNWKNMFDIERQIENTANNELIEIYKAKIQACFEKKNDYDVIIEECEKELNSCADNMNKKIDNLFSNKSSQVVIKEENGFKKFLNILINKFTGSKKFNEYVIEPMKVELEMTENRLPDITNRIAEETIHFVAKIKNAKEQTNAKFERSFK